MPEVAFLDEPTTGLDPLSRQNIWELVGRFKDAGITTLLTTQYLQEADALSDHIIVIDRGIHRGRDCRAAQGAHGKWYTRSFRRTQRLARHGRRPEFTLLPYEKPSLASDQVRYRACRGECP